MFCIRNRVNGAVMVTDGSYTCGEHSVTRTSGITVTPESNITPCANYTSIIKTQIQMQIYMHVNSLYYFCNLRFFKIEALKKSSN